MMMNSCAKLTTIYRFGPDYPKVHPHLKPYIDEVAKLSKGCLGVGIKYAGFFKKDPIPDSVVGRASVVLPYFDAQFGVDSRRWYRFSHMQKIMLVAHELYHVQKPYFMHKYKLDGWGCGEHFMTPKMNTHWCDSVNYERYVKQMQDCK
jgi:hypothetical protein